MTTTKRFENVSIAETITELLRRQSAELNAALEAIEARCSDTEFETYRNAVGQIMGKMYIELLEPIWDQFPELCPDEVRVQFDDPPD